MRPAPLMPALLDLASFTRLAIAQEHPNLPLTLSDEPGLPLGCDSDRTTPDKIN